MRVNEILEGIKQRLDPKCWKGKHKEGTKIKGGIRVNNCVPNENVEEAGSPAQQAAIAISMKKAGKKPKKEVEETAGVGYIPKNKKEANDPRYVMAMTQDIKPGEDSKQAAKWGFNVGAGGKVPKLRADGKF
jgi:hypothetical protein